ncbi:MAG: D-glycero-beta-D-manno-heptose-7-phosphate kinase [Deltaproteobacteria bacterium]|nr:D-glycero-beta-D-manno-heptose-7-phosphate kinase [Deltaproteobacteria bacterium]
MTLDAHGSGMGEAESSSPEPGSLLGRLRRLDLSRLADVRVLVAGDFMLDEYIWGRVDRISPEAPVVVVEVERESSTLGGAGNVVNNLAALGARVEVLGLVGEDDAARMLKRELGRLGIDPAGLFWDPERLTTRKTRVLANQQQAVRIDRETRHPAPPAFLEHVRTRLDVSLPRLQAVILSDYAKGTLTPQVVRELIRRARKLGVPVVVDPKGQDYSAYQGATVVTPNLKELETAVGRNFEGYDEMVAAGQDLRQRLDLTALLVTRGAEGMILIREDGVESLRARTPREVFDVSGAGDTVAAVFTLALVLSGEPLLAAALANLAAGVVVTKRGTAPILPGEIEAELHQVVHQEEKVRTCRGLSLLIPTLKTQGKRVVFTNGCFDLLHVGHIKFLEASRALGDVLVVAVDTDDSVRRLKGEGRPVLNQEQRLRMLAALEVVDYVTVFAGGELPQLLQTFKPDVLTKGSNYPEEAVEGREIVQAYGGAVTLIPLYEDVSISRLINQIRQGEGG